MKILLVSNGAVGQTTTALFERLAETLSERHDVEVRSRAPTKRFLGRVISRMLPDPKILGAVLEAQVLVVQSPVALGAYDVALACLLRKRIIVFLWDLYPESLPFGKSSVWPGVELVFGAIEHLCLRLAERILVPSTDYLKMSQISKHQNVEVFPLWPIERAETMSFLPFTGKKVGAPTRVAFAGQINKLRDLEGAVGDLLVVFSGNIELHIFCKDKFEVPNSSTHEGRLTVVNRGHLPGDEIIEALGRLDAGLVSLDPSFLLPAFPSKTFAYVQAGIPVLYRGPEYSEYCALLEKTGVGRAIDRIQSGGAEHVIQYVSENYSKSRERFLEKTMLNWDRLAQIF